MKEPKLINGLKEAYTEKTVVKKLTEWDFQADKNEVMDPVELDANIETAGNLPSLPLNTIEKLPLITHPLILKKISETIKPVNYDDLFKDFKKPTIIELINSNAPKPPSLIDLIKKQSPVMDVLLKTNSNSFFSNTEASSFFKDTTAEYKAYTSPYQNPSRNSKPTTRSLLVMTEVVWGTLGDYYAAFKLIEAIKKAHPDLTVTWLMRAKDQVLPDVPSTADNVYVIQEWREFFSPENKALQDTMETAATVLQFPSFHFLSERMSFAINHEYRAGKKPMMQCLEYDYEGVPGTKSTHSISAGLGENCLGIFIDEKSPLSKEEHVNTLSDPLRLQLTDGELAKSYLSTHDVFFGYRNKDDKRVLNSVSTLSFVEIILKLASLGGIKKDHIDIIAPFNDEEFANIIMNTKMLKEASILNVIIQNKEGKTQQVKVGDKGKILRLINPFRLNQADMKALLHIAHPFMLCTGDQSLSEVISFSGLPYYQVMQWKAGVISPLLQLTQKVCGIDSDLCEFLVLASLRESNISMTTTKIAQILLTPKIYEEMRTLRDYIAKHKNLYTQLPHYLITEIDKELSNASDAPEEKGQAVRKLMAAC